MAQESLINYIRTQVSSGQRLDSITPILLQQGFSQQQINEAYAQLGYFKKKNFFPVVITIFAILVLLILSLFAFRIKKNKGTVISSYPATTFQTTPAISQTLPNCSDPSHWIPSSETSIKVAVYLKTISVNTCEYTDPFLGYSIRFPANWYIDFSRSHPFDESNATAQPSNFIFFEPRQQSAINSSSSAVSIYITSSKTIYPDIISYMESIQNGKVKLDEAIIEQNQNIYKIVSIDGQKGIQLQYNVGDNVGIDTKFIYNGILYDITLNSISSNEFNANKQYYTIFLNSFTLKLIQ